MQRKEEEFASGKFLQVKERKFQSRLNATYPAPILQFMAATEIEGAFTMAKDIRTRRDGDMKVLGGSHEKGHTYMIPGLPDEIAMLCLARIPPSHRHNTRGVCRSWRDLVQSKTSWDVRLQLACLEHVLLLRGLTLHETGVWHAFHPSTGIWFKLPPKPDDGRMKGSSTFAVVNDKLFVIGGYHRLHQCSNCDPQHEERSSTVSYFDMKLYEWKVTAPLNVPRAGCHAGVINNQLYVCGGAAAGDLENTLEVYSPISRTWRFASPMNANGYPWEIAESVVVGNKFYVLYSHTVMPNLWTSISQGAVYDADQDTWSKTPDGLNSEWTKNHAVEFNGRFCIKDDRFDYDMGFQSSILAYDIGKDMWNLIHYFKVEEDEVESHIWSRIISRDDYPVNIGERLYTLRKFKNGHEPGMVFEIFNVTKQLVASKSFTGMFEVAFQYGEATLLYAGGKCRLCKEEDVDKILRYNVMTI